MKLDIIKRFHLGFEDVDSKNVHELLDSHSNELGDNDLIEIEHQIAYDEKEEENQETQLIAKHITVKELDEFFH